MGSNVGADISGQSFDTYFILSSVYTLTWKNTWDSGSLIRRRTPRVLHACHTPSTDCSCVGDLVRSGCIYDSYNMQYHRELTAFEWSMVVGAQYMAVLILAVVQEFGFTHSTMSRVYREWLNEGVTVHNRQHTGHSATLDECNWQHLRQIINSDMRTTVQELTAQFNIGHATVSLLYDLASSNACRRGPCDLHCISPFISLCRPHPTSIFTHSAV